MARFPRVDVTVHDARDQQVPVGVVYLVRRGERVHVADRDDLTVVHRDRGFRWKWSLWGDDSGVTDE